MVAEAVKPSYKSSVRKGRNRFQPKIDLFTRSQARNLYVVRMLSAKEVAAQTGLTIPQIYNLADREGWTKSRAELKRKSAEALQLREQEEIDELVDAVAIKSKLLSLGSLDAGINELATPSRDQARNLQAYAQAAKVYVGLYRQAKQLDAAQSSEGSTTTNVFFLSALPPAPRITKDVTPAPPAIELTAPAAVEQRSGEAAT